MTTESAWGGGGLLIIETDLNMLHVNRSDTHHQEQVCLYQTIEPSGLNLLPFRPGGALHLRFI